MHDAAAVILTRHHLFSGACFPRSVIARVIAFGCSPTSGTDGHSSKVGDALDGTGIYGKWETFVKTPNLDACGGHYGTTPDSPGVAKYHYHVQVLVPYRHFWHAGRNP